MSLRKHTLIIAALIFISSAEPVGAEEVCDIVKDAVIIAQDEQNTFLGKITSSHDSKSIFNEFGAYGNPFSSSSIWNEFSVFGNDFNAQSPFNKFSSFPPMIVKGKKIIGYLTANKSLKGSISPNLLKALCEEEF